MTPPEAPQADQGPPAVSLCLDTLRKRPDFLALARARRQAMPGFILQARNRRDESDRIRIGFTCSKKVGNAVARNRAKRRLRALAREVLPRQGQSGWDYVLIGRRDSSANLPYQRLVADLKHALDKVHRT